MNVDTKQLEKLEFELLAGTEFMVHLIRNRIKFTCDSDTFDAVNHYLDHFSSGNYYIRPLSNSVVHIYFENVLDKENLILFLRQYSNHNI